METLRRRRQTATVRPVSLTAFPTCGIFAVRLSQRLSLRRKYLLLMMQMTSVNIQLTDEGHLVWMGHQCCRLRLQDAIPPRPTRIRCVAMLCAPVRPCYGWMRLTDDGKLHFLWHRCLPPNKETGLSRC
ncbi:hypothetical protein MTO96_007218 [Rhipicephalus appendiculatus]